SGEFRISGRVTGGTLDYARGWPKLTNVTADLLFDGPQIKITSQRANVLGAQITSATVVVPDPYAPGPPTVLVDGEAQGPTNEFLKYIAQSPVRSGSDGLTDRWTAEGRSNLKLRLELPVGRLELAVRKQGPRDGTGRAGHQPAERAGRFHGVGGERKEPRGPDARRIDYRPDHDGPGNSLRRRPRDRRRRAARAASRAAARRS